jgi:hypothetical protein
MRTQLLENVPECPLRKDVFSRGCILAKSLASIFGEIMRECPKMSENVRFKKDVISATDVLTCVID